jgi:hypothetical protein
MRTITTLAILAALGLAAVFFVFILLNFSIVKVGNMHRLYQLSSVVQFGCYLVLAAFFVKYRKGTM